MGYWALSLKGVMYECVEQDLHNKSDLLLKYFLFHTKIPVLVHCKKPLSVSTVILECIEETWPESPLLPKDPYDRAMARFWIQFGGEMRHATFAFIIAVGEEQEKKIQEARELLRILEEQGLGNKIFFCGNEIGPVDFAFGWITSWLEAIEEAAGVKILDAECFPQLLAWTESFKDHPIIKKSLPDHNEILASYKQKLEKFTASKTA